MYSKNFYDYKMRSLTLKPSFAGMSRREMRIDSALSHNLKGKVSREDCKMLHSDKFSFSTNIPD